MRRADRQILDPAQLKGMLAEGRVLHLGLCGEDGPYVVPLHYGFEEADGALRLYVHGAPEGRKARLIGEGARCWATVTLEGEVTGGGSACGWSSRYASLMMAGFIRPLREDAARRHALDVIMRQLGFEGKPGYEQGALERTLVCQIEVGHITGKRRA